MIEVDGVIIEVEGGGILRLGDEGLVGLHHHHHRIMGKATTTITII